MKKEKKGKLRIIPLGGLEQIGMNITAFEYEDSIVVVDCGLAFPEDDPGRDIFKRQCVQGERLCHYPWT